MADDIIHNPLELLNEQDQRITELERALIKVVDSCLQYEKGEQINFTKEEIEKETKKFTNFSINLDNKQIAELKKEIMQLKLDPLTKTYNRLHYNELQADSKEQEYYVSVVDLNGLKAD